MIYLVLTLCAGADCDEIRVGGFPTLFHCQMAGATAQAAAARRLLPGERVAEWACERRVSE